MKAGQIQRLIYEVNEDAGQAFLMTSTIPDSIFIREDKGKLCRGRGGIEIALPETEEAAGKP